MVELRADPKLAEAVFSQNFSTTILKRVVEAPINRILFGNWNGEDVVVVRTAAERWEIQCHGGRAAVDAIQKSIAPFLIQVGPDTEDRSELTDSDLPRLESQITRTLVQAPTVRTASYVLAQLSGILRQELERLVALPQESEDVGISLRQLRKWSAFSSHLTSPWRVLILGPPNVGKSSLVNAFLGYERSIVFDEAGTTRDVIEAETILDGWPFLICDSAGLRARTDDEIERAGIAGVYDQISFCEIALLVVDVSEAQDELENIVTTLPEAIPCVAVLNKTDLVSEDRLRETAAAISSHWANIPVVCTSTLTGAGIAEAMECLVRTAIPEIPSKSTPLPVTSDLRQRLIQPDNERSDREWTQSVLESIRQML